MSGAGSFGLSAQRVTPVDEAVGHPVMTTVETLVDRENGGIVLRDTTSTYTAGPPIGFVESTMVSMRSRHCPQIHRTY
jgi:hypothetical protein